MCPQEISSPFNRKQLARDSTIGLSWHQYSANIIAMGVATSQQSNGQQYIRKAVCRLLNSVLVGNYVGHLPSTL
jgi:hypothetical protein